MTIEDDSSPGPSPPKLLGWLSLLLGLLPPLVCAAVVSCSLLYIADTRVEDVLPGAFFGIPIAGILVGVLSVVMKRNTPAIVGIAVSALWLALPYLLKMINLG